MSKHFTAPPRGSLTTTALVNDAPELLRELAIADALLHEALNLLEPGQLQRLAERAARIHNGAGVIRATERERLLLKHCGRAKP